MEGLGDEPAADARHAPVVELGLAEDVEPQRRVLREGVALGGVQAAQVGPLAVAVEDLRLREGLDVEAPRPHVGGHLLAGRQLQHPRPGEVAEGEVAVRGGRVRLADRLPGAGSASGLVRRVSMRRAGFRRSRPWRRGCRSGRAEGKV